MFSKSIFAAFSFDSKFCKSVAFSSSFFIFLTNFIFLTRNLFLISSCNGNEILSLLSRMLNLCYCSYFLHKLNLSHELTSICPRLRSFFSRNLLYSESISSSNFALILSLRFTSLIPV